MMRAKSMTLCSKYSDDSQDIFVDRGLATIQVTRLDGTTLVNVNSDKLALNGGGRLLTVADYPSQVPSSRAGREGVRTI